MSRPSRSPARSPAHRTLSLTILRAFAVASAGSMAVLVAPAAASPLPAGVVTSEAVAHDTTAAKKAAARHARRSTATIAPARSSRVATTRRTALAGSDSGTPCSSTVGTGSNCQIRLVAPTAGNDSPGSTPAPTTISHAFNDAQTLTANGVGAIDFYTRGGDGGDSNYPAHEIPYGGAGGDGGHIGSSDGSAYVTVAPGVVLQGANAGGIASFVTQGGNGGGGGSHDTQSGVGAGGRGGNGGSAYVLMNGSISSSDADSPGLRVTSVGGSGGGGAHGGNDKFGSGAGAGGSTGNVGVVVGGSIAVAGTGIDASIVGGPGAAGPQDDGGVSTSFGSPGGTGGSVVMQTASVAVSGSVTSSGSGAVSVRAAGGAGGVGGSAAPTVFAGVSTGGNGGNGAAGGTAEGALEAGTGGAVLKGSSFGLSVAATGGDGGNGGYANGGSTPAYSAQGGSGGDGGSGGQARADVAGGTVVAGDQVAVTVSANGGNGGTGADAGGYTVAGGNGGHGGNAGSATVDFAGTGGSVTAGAAAKGLVAIANGGDGGTGSGTGGGAAKAGNGGDGGSGGTALVVLRPQASVTTTAADDAQDTTVEAALMAQANGGVGGAGGRAYAGIGAQGGGSGRGGAAGTASLGVESDVTTTGSFAYGALAQAAGGAGSTSGSGDSILFTRGGAAQNGGAGGTAILAGMGGTVTTSGTGAVGMAAQSLGGGGGTGGNAIGLVGGIVGLGGNGGAGGDGGEVIVGIVDGDIRTNVLTDTIVTHGGQAIGLLAQSVGGGGGNGGNVAQLGFSPLTLTIGGDGKSAGNGGTVTVNSAAPITTFGDKSGGLSAQSIGGGGGTGGSGVGVDASGVLTLNAVVGGAGGSGGSGGAVNVSNAQQITTYGSDSYGLKAQSVAGGGGEGGTTTAIAASFSGSDPEVPAVSVSVAVGGSGGVGGTGGNVTVNNGGFITTAGHGAYGVVAQSIGGGGGNGGDSTAASYTRGKGPQISISVGAQGTGGAGGTGGTVTVSNDALVMTTGESAHAILAQSIGGGGGTGGAGDVAADTSDSGSFGFSGSLTVGGQGGTGSQGGLVEVTNLAGIATSGDGASGIYAQSIGGGGGTAGGGVAKANGQNLSLSLSVGGSGGAGGNGGQVEVSNAKSVLTTGADASAIYAQSVGGGGGSAGKGSSTAGGTNSAAEVAEAMATTLSNGLNIGQSVVAKGDKVLQIGDGVLKGVTALNDLRKAISGGSSSDSVGASDDPSTDPQPDPKKDGEATNVAVDLTLGGKGGAAGNGALVTVDNQGAVEADGSRSNGIFAQSVGGGGGVGGLTSYSMAVNDKGAGVSVGGSGSAAGAGGDVSVSNDAGASILTTGAAGHGIYAQSIGGGGGKGGLTGSQQGALRNLNLVMGGSGGAGGNGGNVGVDNFGSITTSGEQAFGIFAQSAGGGGGTADVLTDGKAGSPDKVVAIQLDVGGSGGAGGNGGDVRVGMTQTSGGWIATYGNGSIGLVAQSIGGGGGTFLTSSILDGRSIGLSGVTIPVAIGGSGGSSGNGGAVAVELGTDSDDSSPSAHITTTGTDAYAVVAQSIGGGGGLVAGTATPSADMTTLFASAQQKGDGGTVGVTMDHTAWIYTSGDGAAGVLAQSIGGGGGMIGGLSKIDLAAAMQTPSVTEGGQGGNVTVTLDHGANVWTTGTRAHGIVAQSFGGGGGMIAQADGNGYAFSAASPYTGCSGSACTGAVTVSLANGALVRAQGPESYAIVAQSRGNGVNDATVNVNPNGWVEAWQDAAGAIFMGGAGTNTINNQGIIDDGTSTDATHGRSKAGIAITGNQPITVNNSGVIHGSQILDGSGGSSSAPAAASAGAGQLNNLAGGVVVTGDEIRLGGGVLSNAGTLEIGGSRFAQTHVAGSLQQLAGGRLVVDIDTVTGASDKLVVDGSAKLAGIVHVRPRSLSPNPISVMQAAGGVTIDPSATVEDEGGNLLFGYDLGHDADGGLAITPYSKLASDAIRRGVGSSRASLARHLDAGFNDRLTPFQARVYAQLATLPTMSSAAAGFDNLAGEVLHSAAAARLMGSIQFSERMNSVSCDSREHLGVAPREVDCAWARTIASRTTRASTPDEAGFSMDASTAQLGAQRRIASDWLVGGALAFDQSRMKGNDTEQRVSGNGSSAGVVLKYTPGAWSASAAIDGGFGRYDSDRHIALGDIAAEAKARFDMWHLGLHGRLAYLLPFDAWYVRPYVDAHAVHIRNGAYRESGADALDLEVDSDSRNYLSVSPMVEFGALRELGGTQLRTFAAFGAVFHGSAQAGADARLAGWSNAGQAPSFSATSSLAKRRAKADLGVTAVLRKDMELSVSYEGEFAAGFRSQGGNVQFHYLFD